MLLTKLKAELNCPVCQLLFQHPLLLPCGHSVCSACANKLWFFSREGGKWPVKSTVDSRCTSSVSTPGTCSYTEDAVSEADSGVVICGTDSNGSLNNAQLLQTSLVQSPNFPPFGREPCPVCATVPKLPLDMGSTSATVINTELAQNWWPKNVALEKLIARLTADSTPSSIDGECEARATKAAYPVNLVGGSPSRACQLCHTSVDLPSAPAVSFCEQCQLLYCAACLSKWHPQSGLLTGHKLVPAQQVSPTVLVKLFQSSETGVQCPDHTGQMCNLFCVNCAQLVCVHCLPNSARRCCSTDAHPPTLHAYHSPMGSLSPNSDNSPARVSSGHAGHVICSASIQARRQKTEITRLIHALSEQARRGADMVQELKTSETRLKKSVPAMETALNREIDALVRQLEERRTRLLEQLRSRMHQRGRHLREQSVQLGSRLSATTSLLHFGVELLKESDAAAFIQVSPALRRRLTSTEVQFVRELQQSERGGEVELRVNTTGLCQQIEQLQLEDHHAPPIPEISKSETTVDGNALHVVWYAYNRGGVCSSQSLASFSHLCSILPPLLSHTDEKSMGSPQLSVSDVSGLLSGWHLQPCNPSRGLSGAGPPTRGGLFGPGHRLTTTGRNPNFPASVSAYLLSERDPGSESFGHHPIPVGSSRHLHELNAGGVSFGACTSTATTASQSMSTLHTQLGMLGDSPAADGQGPDCQGTTFFLEVDNGRGGPFKVAYSGPETVCRLEGLQFNTPYRLRVRAANLVGYSAYSEIVTLRTSRLSKFHVDPSSGLTPTSSVQVGLHVDPDGMCVSALGETEDRVLLGDVGFSQGVHYWEWQVEAYDGRGQPSFGVALTSVARERMLGLDSAGWAIYLNSSRSWFLHAGQHRDRTDGGLALVPDKDPKANRRPNRPTVVGVRLDCDQGQLGFYLNGEPHGPIAFTDLHASARDHMECAACDTQSTTISGGGGGGSERPRSLKPILFYPALSLSHHTRVRLVTGLEVPSESEESSEASEAEYDVSIDATSTQHESSPSSSTPCNVSSKSINTTGKQQPDEMANGDVSAPDSASPSLVRDRASTLLYHSLPTVPGIASSSSSETHMSTRLTTFGRS